MTQTQRDSFIVFGAPVIEQPEIDEVVDCLRSGWLGKGPKVARFEEMFREVVGVDYAIAVSSCTAGMHLSLIASGVGPGDEVITTPMTFVATVNAILHVGATPVLVDCEPITGSMDPARLAQAITPRTRAIMPVHLYGRPCPMDSILAIAEQNGLLVIEDAAHAIGAAYRGRQVGRIGDLTCFSFYVTKNVVTGEGGMVTTNDAEVANRIKTYALHGMTQDAWRRYSDEGFEHYRVIVPGFKYNMMDLQAAIGIHQLPRIEGWRRRREAIWRQYDAAFADLPLTRPPPVARDTVHARHLYTLLVDPERCQLTRDQMIRGLHHQNIGAGVHFVSVHLHPYYRDRFGFRPDDFPNATWISERTVSIPLSPGLSPVEVDRVIAAVRSTVAGAA